MRADNNWEDSVGKRLFDVEGELSPQAWENISLRIAPKPKRPLLWYWLPALLLFVALPLAFYLGKFSGKSPSDLAKTESQNAQEKIVVKGQETGQLKNQQSISGSEN